MRRKRKRNIEKIKEINPTVFHQHASKVAHYIRCTECGAARTIRKLAECTEEQIDQLAEYANSVAYICGDDLFANYAGDGDGLPAVFVVQRAISGQVHSRATGKKHRQLLCGVPTEKVYYKCAQFPRTCAWCEQDNPDGMVSEATIANEGVARKSYPICQPCFARGKAVPFMGQKDHTKKRVAGKAGRGGTRRLKSKTQPLVAQRGLRHGPRGPDAGGGRVAMLLKTKRLVMWRGPTNAECHACSTGGEVCECYSCNLVWHKECMGPSKATRAETDHLLEGSADWVCGFCYDQAMDAHETGRAKPKVRAKSDRGDACHSSECTLTVKELNGDGYDYHCLLIATPEDVEDIHQRTARLAASPDLCWDIVEGLDTGSAACTSHLGLNTLAEMGATPRGHYTVVADMSADPPLGMAAGGSGGVIESDDSDSSSYDGGEDVWGGKSKK